MGLKRFLSESAVRFATRGTVSAGPFNGMQLRGRSFGSVLSPKLLGTYESETNHFVEQILARAPQRVINVGTAEGYYAIGFARRAKDCEIVAFEQSEIGRELLTANAQLNGVLDRTEIFGSCDIESLRDCIKPDKSHAIIMDVEGYENTLLDPEKIPELSRISVFVEVHLGVDPQIENRLRERFEDSHTVDRELVRKFSRSDIPPEVSKSLSYLPGPIINKALDEQRCADDCWLLMLPKTN